MSKQNTCPVCGSINIVRVQSSQMISVSGDRFCNSCETQWAPPTPKWAAGIIIVICIPLLLGDLALLISSLVGKEGGIGFAFFLGIVLIFVISGGIYSSFQVLTGKGGELKIVKEGRIIGKKKDEMSDFKFDCPHCKQSLEAPEELLGQVIDCPSCNSRIQIPNAKSAFPCKAQQPPQQEEMEDYINRTVGISRKALNIRAAIGIIVFGWLMMMNYDDLGKKGLGWAFIIAMAFVFAIARQVHSMVGIVGPIIYIAAWVHTNAILTEKQHIAREQYFKENNTHKN